MSDKPSLDSLRIDRARTPQRRGFLIPVLVAIVLVAASGAAAYVFWPAPGVPVHVVTAEGRESGNASGLDATGYVVARRQATLSAKILGKLVELNVEEGQRIEQGQVVARLDDSNYVAALRQAEAQDRLAKTALDDAAPIFVRYQRLKGQGAISTDAFENQKAVYDAARQAADVAQAAVVFAQSNKNDTIVRAPFTGIVTSKVAQVGEIVAPAAAGGGDTRTGIATIVDMDSLEVQVDVSENYIDRVHAGGEATIQLDAYPDWQIPAAVIAIIPTADQSKGTVKVRVAIKTRDARILPQMGARVSFVTEPGSARVPLGVTAPLQAVKDHGRTGQVFVVRDDNTVEQRQVALGLKTTQSVTILSGVTAGDRLVSGDLDKLRDGVKVAVQE